MKYIFQPLQTTDQYLRYFEERCRHNKAFFPDYGGYYLGQFEMDTFDLHSLHLGIFMGEHPGELVGFARLTLPPTLLASPSFSPLLPDEVQSIIQEAASPTTYPLPLWENYELSLEALSDQIPHGRSGSPSFMEVGRLIVLTKQPNPRIITNFLTYLLTIPTYLGADSLLASHTHSHHQFYQRYFGISKVLHAPYRHGSSMMAAQYNLNESWTNGQELRDRLIEVFTWKGVYTPISFDHHRFIQFSTINV